jgi:menaquinone-dependent protoporphyrinogen oxidase
VTVSADLEGLLNGCRGTFDPASATLIDGTLDLKCERWSDMTKILIAYGTTEGQTARIADHIADVIRNHGIEAQALDLKQSKDLSLNDYDGVIVGGSIHMGKHQEDVADFVQKNRAVLERLPSAFFSVSLAAHGDMENAEAYVANFQQQTGWHPTKVGLFSGALLYRKYGFLKRYMMKRIVRDKPGGLSADTSRDHVYTDWDQVQRFADDFLERLVPQDAAKIKS